MVLMESVQSEGVPFDGLIPSDIKNSKWGNTEPEKNFRFQTFIPSIVSNVENFAEFNSDTYF